MKMREAYYFDGSMELFGALVVSDVVGFSVWVKRPRRPWWAFWRKRRFEYGPYPLAMLAIPRGKFLEVHAISVSGIMHEPDRKVP